MLIIFMFLSGIARSTALTNVAGTIADLFGDADSAGHPMGLFVLAGSIGPSIGSPFGAWIGANPSLGLRWLYLFNVIVAFGFAIIMSLIPETLPRLVIANAAAKNGTANVQEVAILKSKVDMWKEIRFVTTTTFRIMFTEPIISWLGAFNGMSYGVLFLYLDSVQEVFAVDNGLSYVFHHFLPPS
jgi:MFS family permease